MKPSWRPGSPNPMKNATMMIGVPRKKSVYAIARARSGLAPRPGRPRITAIASANTRTSTSATTIILRFTWKPAHTSGIASVKLCRLKNAWRTWWSACTTPLLQDGNQREVEVEPLLLELADRTVRDQRLHGRVHDRQELRALLKHRAVLLVRGDLAGHRPEFRRVLLLLEADERHVENQRVTLVDLHRLVGGRRRRERERLLRRVQLRLDPVEARGVRLGARLHLLQVGEALRRGRLLREEHALIRVQVRRGEVDRPLPLRGDRRLLERDVELLRAGREQAVPRREHPDRREAELLGDCGGEVDLVAARIRDRVAADRAAGEARSRIAEGDDQLARLECRHRCGPGRRRRNGHERRDREDREKALHELPSCVFGTGNRKSTAVPAGNLIRESRARELLERPSAG